MKNTAKIALVGLVSPPRRAARHSPPRRSIHVSFRAHRGATSAPSAAAASAAVTGVVGQPGMFYIGLPAAGVWKTTSAGETWYPDLRRDQGRLVDRRGRGRAVGSERHLRRHRRHHHRRRRSTKGTASTNPPTPGTTWQHLGLDATKQIPTMLVDPHDPNVVLRRRAGERSREEPRSRGVFRSTDGGATWTQTLFVDDSTGIQKLARAFDMPRRDLRDDRRPLHAATAAAPQRDSAEAEGAAATQPDRRARSSSSRWTAASTWKEITGGGLPRVSRARRRSPSRTNTNAQRVFVIGDCGPLPLRRRRRDLAPDGRRRSDEFETARAATTAASTSIRRTRTSSTRSTHRATSPPTAARPSPASRARPAATTRSRCGSIRRTAQRILFGYDQGAIVSLDGGAHVELVVQPVDRADLPPLGRQLVSVLGLRHAAGRRRHSHARPRQPRRDHAARLESGARAGSGARSSPIRSTRTPCTPAASAS